jgi:adenosylcobinamide kinase/adenosylcobinamide-phosphate guanylyltransferase
VLVDGVLSIDPGRPSDPGPDAAGYRVERGPGGWAVTGPDGGRLLVGEGQGLAAAPGGTEPYGVGPRTSEPDTTRPYDIVLLDLLENPAQLGALRHRGLVHTRTVVAVLHADHRVSSEEELTRRGQFWGIIVPHDGDVLATTPGPAPASSTGASSTGASSTGASSTGASSTGASSTGGGPSRPRRVLVLGGARSGKSRHAELRLAAEPQVTYLAAGPYPPGAQPADDSEWRERVAAHRTRRPPWWQTVESIDAAGMLRSESGAVLFDGAGTWLAAVMDESGAWAGEGEAGPAARAQARIAAKVDELIEAWRQTRAQVVAVSDEVGSSVHPPTRAGLLFRDQLGWLNQRLAAESEETVLMIAGRAMTLPS